MQDVLIINSYAGSLVLGAKQAGYTIRGSYEDDGYGIEAQKLNFPDLKYVDRLPWPEDKDLTNTMVIAHPPCAPFSIMSPNKGDASKAGVSADGFICHRNVMEYALSRHCASLAIESVPGVMKAADVYRDTALAHGYDVFFVNLNSIGFGVPQWRPRVWIIFLPVGDGPLALSYKPVYRKLSDILLKEGTLIERGAEPHIMIRRLQEAKVSAKTLREIFTGEHGIGTLLQIGQNILGIEQVGPNFKEVREAWNLGGLYAAMMPRILDPDLWAPTILNGSAWFVVGRPLFLEEYNQIMGFPADYKWPTSFTDPRQYLSKGVCPPIAAWILDQMRLNLALHFEGEMTHTCQPGELVDLKPKKAEVEDFLRQGKLPGFPEPKPKNRKARQAAPLEMVRSNAVDATNNFMLSLGSDEVEGE